MAVYLGLPVLSGTVYTERRDPVELFIEDLTIWIVGTTL